MTSLLEKNESGIDKALQRLFPLLRHIQQAKTLQEKIDIVGSHPLVQAFFGNEHPLEIFLTSATLEEEYAIKSVVALGQGSQVFFISDLFDPLQLQRLQELLRTLIWVEKFYAEIGGVIGYHCKTLHLLTQMAPDAVCSEWSTSSSYEQPQGMDIERETHAVREAILWGIDHLPEIAEIYPVGGAADRLRLQDVKTGVELPAAKLMFCGRTLLETMIRDVQAREYLYYKLKGEPCTIPIAMMTSYEKENHAQILAICEANHWFGRSKDSFHFFCQPLVPTMNQEGQWCLQGPLQLLLKPGGHGVIWKLARDVGVLDWFSYLGKKKALLRQINNPIAGTDYGLLAFAGIGSHYDKAFGFASCPRHVSAAEGVNVLIERENAQGTSQGTERLLTNIEYCDFKKRQICDEPAHSGTSYSKFPSNTNILFADLKTIAETVSAFPIPGLLVNLKKAACRTPQGQVEEQKVVRLESTMQNIADYLGTISVSSQDVFNEEQLRVFLTYNKRCKTISAIKREYVEGSSVFETPEGCFLDLMRNAHELLHTHCGMQVPTLDSVDHSLPFLFFYHPALGPLYSIIGQKIRGGKLAKGSEWQLEIADVDCEALDLEGSLLIHAKAVMGQQEEEVLRYSTQSGKCTLKNVRVRNAGVDGAASQSFWKTEILRSESCTILIHGNGEFFAENITLSGHQFIEVAEGIRMTAYEKDGQVVFRQQRIQAPTWQWHYTVQDHCIKLNVQTLS